MLPVSRAHPAARRERNTLRCGGQCSAREGLEFLTALRALDSQCRGITLDVGFLLRHKHPPANDDVEEIHATTTCRIARALAARTSPLTRFLRLNLFYQCLES